MTNAAQRTSSDGCWSDCARRRRCAAPRAGRRDSNDPRVLRGVGPPSRRLPQRRAPSLQLWWLPLLPQQPPPQGGHPPVPPALAPRHRRAAQGTGQATHGHTPVASSSAAACHSRCRARATGARCCPRRATPPPRAALVSPPASQAIVPVWRACGRDGCGEAQSGRRPTRWTNVGRGSSGRRRSSTARPAAHHMDDSQHGCFKDDSAL
eukprot:scaffold48651_cov57-Phaeocystis_antarctica.AAC.1